MLIPGRVVSSLNFRKSPRTFPLPSCAAYQSAMALQFTIPWFLLINTAKSLRNIARRICMRLHPLKNKSVLLQATLSQVLPLAICGLASVSATISGFRRCIGSWSLSRMWALIVSSAWPFPRIEHFRTLALARAIENQSYVIASNRVGKDDDLWFCGSSAIIDPRGVMVASASADREELIQADVSEDLVLSVRSRVESLAHRRQDLYN